MGQMSGRWGMFGRVGFALVLGAAALGSGACVATRDWVRDDIREADKPIQAKLAQLEASMAQEKARVDGRLAQLDGRVGQVDGRVTQVEGRVGQVAAQVTEARRVADEGVQKAGAVDARLTQALANRYKRELVSTVSMFFAPGKSQLLPLHRDALNGVLKVLADNPTYTADVVGYTDGEGPRGYNLTLSWLREEAARRYLAERGQVLNRLSFIGVGEDLTRGDRNHPMARARDRQVAILIFRPGQ